MRTPEQRERFRQGHLKRAANPVVDPTEEQIAERCAEIKASWSDAEHVCRWLMARTIGRFDQRDYLAVQFPRFYGEV